MLRHLRLVSSIFLSLLAAVAVFSFGANSQTEERPAKQNAVSTPDLSGVWIIPRAPAGVRRTPGAFTAEEPSMTPAGQAKYKAIKAAYYGGTALRDPVFSCFPPGVPRIYIEQPLPLEIIQIPGRVIERFEYDHFIREIYTDGRQHSEDIIPTWMGDSIGKWEGDTLVVDTIGFNDKTIVDKVGHPHSDALHVVERIRRVDRNNLQIDITIDDPKMYTKPWGGQLVMGLKPDWRIAEHICEDNANFSDFQKKSTAGSTRNVQPK